MIYSNRIGESVSSILASSVICCHNINRSVNLASSDSRVCDKDIQAMEERRTYTFKIISTYLSVYFFFKKSHCKIFSKYTNVSNINHSFFSFVRNIFRE